MSLKRKKQFAILQPATKTRFEIGLNIKGQEPTDILEAIRLPDAMCSHKIQLSSEEDLSDEVINWIRAAYEKAG